MIIMIMGTCHQRHSSVENRELDGGRPRLRSILMQLLGVEKKKKLFIALAMQSRARIVLSGFLTFHDRLPELDAGLGNRYSVHMLMSGNGGWKGPCGKPPSLVYG